jgi:hypothetical protein
MEPQPLPAQETNVRKETPLFSKPILVTLFIVMPFFGAWVGNTYTSQNTVLSTSKLTPEMPQATTDLETIRPVGELVSESYGYNSRYAIASSGIYYLIARRSPDSASFELLRGSLEPLRPGNRTDGGYLGYLYARDEHRVYYEGEVLHGAKPLTFRPIENGHGSHSYGTDGERVYFGSTLIPNADPATFTILWQTVWEGCLKSTFSKDTKSVYFRSTPLQDADPDTFEALYGGYAKDKRGYYNFTEFLGPSIDPTEAECLI